MKFPFSVDVWVWLSSPAVQTAIAGALGGIVRWLTLQEHWRDGLLSLVVGAICAIYLGPLAEPMLRPVIGKVAPGGEADGFASFVVGLGGISISSFVIDVLRHAGERARRGAKGNARMKQARHDDEPEA